MLIGRGTIQTRLKIIAEFVLGRYDTGWPKCIRIRFFIVSAAVPTKRYCWRNSYLQIQRQKYPSHRRRESVRIALNYHPQQNCKGSYVAAQPATQARKRGKRISRDAPCGLSMYEIHCLDSCSTQQACLYSNQPTSSLLARIPVAHACFAVPNVDVCSFRTL